MEELTLKKLIILVLCLVFALSMVGCDSKTKDNDAVTMTATISDISTDNEMDALYVTANDKNYVIYNWKDFISDGTTLHIGDDVEIEYNGITTEEEPSGLCGVTRVTN